MFKALLIAGALLCACGTSTALSPDVSAAAAPTITGVSVGGALNGALIVKLATATPGATMHYSVDGSDPTAASQTYEAPFLVAANLTVKAVAVVPGSAPSAISSQSFAPNIPSGALVWSDEFANSASTKSQPDPEVWSYDTGNNGFGNHELEDYCAWGSTKTPCSSADPSAYVGTDGYLHIVARETGPGVYTSARLKSQGLFSFQYGRIEFRAKVPEAQGLWPAAWLLGNNIATVDWPACGEMDVLERVDAAKTPDWNEGSVHGPGFTGDVGLGTIYNFPMGQTAAQWHTYGMIWKAGSVAYYVDNPAQPYVTYTTPGSIKRLAGAQWPFDAGQASFILLNMAIGGDWPKSPNASTPFPSEMLVDYVRIYTN
jgi:beta-glucanase (GH16 family)